MISDKQCRKILEEDGDIYSDEDIRNIKGLLYKMAEIVLETKEIEQNG